MPITIPFQRTLCLGLLAMGGCATTSHDPAASHQSATGTAQHMQDFQRYGFNDLSSGEADATRSGLRQMSFSDEGQSTDPSIDRQGRQMAFSSNRHGATHDLYVRMIDGGTITRVTTNPAEDVMPAFSPDGSVLAFASDRAGNFDIWTVAINGGAPTRLTADDAHEYHPTFSPDGRRLAYCRTNPRTERNEIWYIDLSQPMRRVFVEYGTMPEWSPDPAESVLVFQQARERGRRSYALWTVDVHDQSIGRPQEIISAANAAAINPTWSPDAEHIAFATVSEGRDGHETMDLWTIRRNGTKLRHLTADAGEEYQPCWSADGCIYFVSTRSGNSNIWSVADGATARPENEAARLVGAEGAP